MDVLPENNSTPVESLSTVLNESREMLKNEAIAQIKRGRGRPKGTFKIKTEQNGGGSASTSPTSPDLGAGPLPHSRTIQDQMPISLSDIEPISTEIVKTPFALWARKENDSELELKEEEAKAPAYYLSNLIRLYAPDLAASEPRKFHFFALIVSLLLNAVRRVNKSKKEAKKEEFQQPDPTQPIILKKEDLVVTEMDFGRRY